MTTPPFWERYLGVVNRMVSKRNRAEAEERGRREWALEHIDLEEPERAEEVLRAARNLLLDPPGPQPGLALPAYAWLLSLGHAPGRIAADLLDWATRGPGPGAARMADVLTERILPLYRGRAGEPDLRLAAEVLRTA